MPSSPPPTAGLEGDAAGGFEGLQWQHPQLQSHWKEKTGGTSPGPGGERGCQGKGAGPCLLRSLDLSSPFSGAFFLGPSGYRELASNEKARSCWRREGNDSVSQSPAETAGPGSRPILQANPRHRAGAWDRHAAPHPGAWHLSTSRDVPTPGPMTSCTQDFVFHF